MHNTESEPSKPARVGAEFKWQVHGESGGHAYPSCGGVFAVEQKQLRLVEGETALACTGCKLSPCN